MLSTVRWSVSSLFVLALALALASCGGGEDDSIRLVVAANSVTELTVAGPLGTTLLVPAGASSTDVTIVLSAPTGRRLLASAFVAVGPQIRLLPDGATFEKPLEISIPIEPSTLPGGSTIDDVVVLRVAADSDVFVPLPTRRVGNAVVASTEHFCDFIPVVLVDPMVNPFGACLDQICASSETCAGCPSDCGVCLPSGDTTPPSVLSATASGPSASLPADAVFTIVFDEPLMPASVSAQSFILSSQSGSIAYSFAHSGATVTITPAAPLPPALNLMFEISGVRDLAGNVMTAKAAPIFMTATQSSVGRLSTSPATGDVGVHPRQDLVFTFSGPVDVASFTIQSSDTPNTACTGTVRVNDGVTCFGGNIVALSPTSIAVRPTSSLVLSSSVTVSIAGVTDTFGYPLAAFANLSFRVSPVNGFAYRIGRGPSVAGDRGGIAGADAGCDPTGTGKRKAFLLATTRYPCVTANCAGTETGPVDWVMKPNTTYVNAAGALLFTTDATHPIFVGWPMPNIFFAGGLNFAWGGSNNVSDWLLNPTANCSDWTTSSGAQTYSVGYENSQTSGFIAGGAVACSGAFPHLCVDQVPTMLPATH
jgi:hypothetical protein